MKRVTIIYRRGEWEVHNVNERNVCVPPEDPARPEMQAATSLLSKDPVLSRALDYCVNNDYCIRSVSANGQQISQEALI
jgi:hypothetical protein